MKPNTTIIPFPQPEPRDSEPWPTGLEGLVYEAQLATDLAFGECIEQLQAVKLADDFERDGDKRRAADLRRIANRKAAGVVEGFIEALAYLGKARRGAIRKLEELKGRIPSGDEKLERAAAAVIGWSDDKPASELLEPAWVIVGWLKTVAPATGGKNPMAALDTSRWNGSDMRVRARIHGASLEFLERVAHLTHLPWLTRAA